jgi:long-chain acyl-CoA synthetase
MCNTSTMSARSLAELVRTAAAENPDKPALLHRDTTVTWGELDALVDAAAAGLHARVPGHGERVGILLPNSVGFVVAYFAVLRAGLVAVPFNTAYTPPELDHQILDAGTALVVTDAEHEGLLDSVPADQVVVMGSRERSWDDLLAAGVADEVGDAPGGEDLALLLYTSGTTGAPRGAMLTHRALLANLEQLARIEPKVVSGDDIVLLVLPLFHVYGLNAGLGQVAWAGATAVLADRFDPVETLALVHDRHVSNIVGAPPMFVAWSMLPDLEESLASVRLAVSGAAPLPPAVLSHVLESTGHHIFEGYGLTETAPVLTSTLCSEVAKPGSVGRPIPGIESKILDDDGDEVDEDDPGEFVVRGPNLFSGYWPDGAGGPGADGWFRTGDIAYADTDGDLYLVDRIKELILVSGFNVYPREVEQVLETHPDVHEVAVIGVAHPYTGETVKALVVPRRGTSPSAEELIEHAARRLARFKCPTSVELVDQLPHSLSGKVAKGRLRDRIDVT